MGVTVYSQNDTNQRLENKAVLENGRDIKETRKVLHLRDEEITENIIVVTKLDRAIQDENGIPPKMTLVI